MASDPPTTAGASDAELATCDREPIHIPGAIQPHGVLLALGLPDLRVVQASANVGGSARAPGGRSPGPAGRRRPGGGRRPGDQTALADGSIERNPITITGAGSSRAAARPDRSR